MKAYKRVGGWLATLGVICAISGFVLTHILRKTLIEILVIPVSAPLWMMATVVVLTAVVFGILLSRSSIVLRKKVKEESMKVSIEGLYYVKADPDKKEDSNNQVVISRLSDTQYRTETPGLWDGVGIFDGKTYFGVFKYKDTIGSERFVGVWGVHKGELLSNGSLKVHGTNMVKVGGSFDIEWVKVKKKG